MNNKVFFYLRRANVNIGACHPGRREYRQFSMGVIRCLLVAFKALSGSVEERREPFHGGLTAASVLPTSSPKPLKTCLMIRIGQDRRVKFAVTIQCLLWLVLGLTFPAMAETVIDTEAERDYGYHLGDELAITWQIRADGRLQSHSLPKPGPVNDWLILKAITQVTPKADFDQAYRLTYQLFKRVSEAQQLALPDVDLSFQQGRSEQAIKVKGFRFHYTTQLSGEDWAKHHDPKPEIAPPPLDDRSAWRGFLISLSLTLALLLYLAWFYGKITFLERFSGPFARSLRELKQLKPGAETDALRLLHRALNQTLGKTVTLSQLPDFFQAHPRFKGLESETQALFRHSEALFFAPNPTSAAPTLSQLIDLCARYRKRERGGRWG
ncbi:MAG: hypothetical protein RQ715_00060 [Methylococcales bacterium]|nr:hypothetical protein [Methylococcales bacterium]